MPQTARMEKPHLLIDLGQVLLSLSEEKCIKAFSEISAKPTLLEQQPLFDALERGEYTAEEFREEVQVHLWRDVFPKEIDKAWNALVLPLDPAVIKLLKKLKKRYTLSLVSNINIIHHAYIKQMLGPFAYHQFISSFDHLFLSYEIGTRKPENTFYQKVLDTLQVTGDTMTFVDDKPENLAAAKDFGITGIQFSLEEKTIHDLGKVLLKRHS